MCRVWLLFGIKRLWGFLLSVSCQINTRGKLFRNKKRPNSLFIMEGTTKWFYCIYCSWVWRCMYTGPAII